MLVVAKPHLFLTPLLDGGGRAPLAHPWCECSFFLSGGDALAVALRRLRVRPGSRVFLPALVCKAVPDRLVREGYIPMYVDSAVHTLQPALDDFARGLGRSDVGALLLIDLFGFLPANRMQIAALARDSGCRLIEDRCHCALAQPPEEVADAVVYSIRKTLPVSDGGALWLADPALRNLHPGVQPIVRSLSFVAQRLAERAVCAVGWPNIYSGWVGVAHRSRQRNSCDSEPSARAPAFARSWVLDRHLRDAVALSRIAARRRENYRRLAEVLPRSLPLLGGLGEYDVPQVFPVLDATGGMAEYLRRHGVGANRWPGDELPAEVAQSPMQYPNANRFNREICCLPINQSIESRHIERMATLVERYGLTGSA